jgi:hypothetical protein
MFCHGDTPGNARTNVVSGLLRDTLNNPLGALKGGGFDSATMNTDTNVPIVDGDQWTFPLDDAVQRDTTSKHTLGETFVWGMGDNDGTTYAGDDMSTPLSCVSCHDPHEFGETYRMLKSQPTGSTIGGHGSTTFAYVTDILVAADVEADDSYLSYTTDDYAEVEYASPDVYDDAGDPVIVTYIGHGPTPPTATKYSQQMSKWCSSCHTRYHAEKDGFTAPGSVDSGDPIFAFGHKTGDAMEDGVTSTSCGYGGADCHGSGQDHNKNLSCLGCHVAHGTASTMNEYVTSLPWPGTGGTTYDGIDATPDDGSTTGTDWDGEGRSNLLRLDNRAACQNYYCHPMGDGTYTEGHVQGDDF